MGNKESIKGIKFMNNLNTDKISSERNHHTNDNYKNIFKRNNRVVSDCIKMNKESKTMESMKNNNKKNIMTKEQRNLLKSILKKNMKENKKRIAKNLAGIFLESSKNNKLSFKIKIKNSKDKNNLDSTGKNSEKTDGKSRKYSSNDSMQKIKRFSSLVPAQHSNFSKLLKINKHNEGMKNKEHNDKEKLSVRYMKADQNNNNLSTEAIIIENNDDENENEKENEYDIDDSGVRKLKSEDIDDYSTPKMNFTSLFRLHQETTDIPTNSVNNFSTIFKRKSFRDFVENNNKKDYDECLKFINSTQIISHLEEYEKSLLIQSLKVKNLPKGQCLLKAHQKCNVLLFVKEGLLQCVDDEGTCIKTLTVGEYFGEKEILTGDNIDFNLITISDCICYSISVRTFKKIIGNEFRNVIFYNFMKAAFECSELFQTMNIFYIEKICKFFNLVHLNKDNVAFPIGHIKSSKFVIIITGNLINSKNGKIIGSSLDILYEEELLSLNQEKINYALYPSSETLFLEADTNEILYNLKCKSFEDVLNKNIILENLSQITLFKSFSQLKLYKLIDLIQIEKYKNGEKIIKEGTQGEKFYIVKEGQVEIYQKNIYLRTLNKMEYFGERALLTNEVRSATVIAKNDVELYSLDSESFHQNLSEMMLNYLNISLYLHDETVSLDDLIFIKEVGKGNYGSVSLVMNKRTKFPYAIKAINKYHIITENMTENIELEKNILLKIDHPFIVKLVKCLKDENNIFFLLEYIKGKELFDVIRDIGYLNKDQTNFYIASMMIAIQYLHERKIIYRDIKPENIIIETNGYLKLIDFGTAKEIEDRTKTIIGTPHYMAPEIILGGGYSFQVDFWSISICMYEFMCGQVPFGEKDDDPMEIYFSIINDHLGFPNEYVDLDKEFKHLMRKMLDKNPSNRLSNFHSIKNSSWFKDFKWDELTNLNLKAPYLPVIPYSSFDFDEQCKPLFNEANQNFPNYVDIIKNNNNEAVIENKEEITKEKITEYEKWYNKF